MRELQVYALGRDGGLVHAAPQTFRDTLSLASQCLALELQWRRWRDLQVASWRPVGRARWRQTRAYPAPIDDRREAVEYRLVDNKTGAFVACVPLDGVRL